MNPNIYKALKNASSLYPLHMPGHKRNIEILEKFKEFIELDFTEIDDTDNMHKANGVIKLTKDDIAKIFKTKESYFLVNGSSSGVLASILSCVKENDKILLSRACHISVYNGVVLSGATPIYVYPKIKNGLSCAISLEDVKDAVKKNKNIKAFILTSPTYEGLVSDIEAIANFLHQNNILLIIDEAHGGHFVFSKDFPKSALECGADIVIHSLHKTMPCLTQCAILHINSDRVDKNRLEKCLSMVQTTSPSYIFMLSIEYAVYFANNNLERFSEYTNFLKIYREDFKKLKNIKLIDKDILDEDIVDFDISRLTFLLDSNINGYEINNILRKNNFQLEMYGKNHIIAISTICDDFDMLQKFKNILFDIDKNLEQKSKTQQNIYYHKPQIAISPKEAFFKDKTFIDLEDSQDKICGDFIIVYPPGSPVLAPGEIITKEIIVYIKDCIKNNISLIGVDENKICILL